jgi:hypothetical protein
MQSDFARNRRHAVRGGTMLEETNTKLR